MERGAWRGTVHRLAKSWTGLSDLAQHSTSDYRIINMLLMELKVLQ